MPSPQASFETPPAGSHGAVLVAIIDLGTQRESFQGGPERDQHQIYLVWELTGCKMTGSEHTHLIGRRYTFSLAEKAALRRLVKSWRGRDVSSGEDFDVLAMLGKKCLLSISHNESGDKVYANLEGVFAPEPGRQVPDPKRKPVARQVTSAEPVPDWLPYIYGEPVLEVIKRAKELLPAATNGSGAVLAANGSLAARSDAKAAEEDQEIPF